MDSTLLPKIKVEVIVSKISVDSVVAFELHTSYEDKENYYRNLRNPWLLILLMFAIFAVAKCSVVFGVLALVSLIPVLVYQTQVMQNKREGKTKEW